jgi:prepilin-type processing-associated H-X9-DG protein
MFCSKCGVENQDGAQICRSCGWVLTNAGALKAKTSALAITSLVLGILSFCTILLTAPLAIIFGIISLIMISKSKGQLKGTGLAIAGIAVPVIALPFVALIMGITMPAMVRARMVAHRIVCGTNMSSITKAMLIYAGDNKDRFPDSDHWCDLLIQTEKCNKKQFKCVGDKVGPSSYAMNKNVEKLGSKSSPDMVLLFESKPGWNQSGGPELLTTENHSGEGCNVAFCDGHVAFIRAEDIAKLKWTAGP